MPVDLVVDGRPCTIVDEHQSLLSALREELGVRSPKDGCSPQGQCGCCTVLVDGEPRVSCVTAVRRVAGRRVTTADGLDPDVAGPLVAALVTHGGSQCGFCTPGIVCRLAALGPAPAPARVERALLAHLCRCTGWRGVLDAAQAWHPGPPVDVGPVGGGADRDRRAAIEGRVGQLGGAEGALGRGGFADDTAPAGALVAVPDRDGGWALGATLAQARAASGARPGRRSGRPLSWPVDLPPGDWTVTLQTTWVEPAYLEPDASWCHPGGRPASPAANGGAFGGKVDSPLPEAARMLADRHGRPVRALWSRDDVVWFGPKRPPVAFGVRADGTGVLRVARTPGIAAAVAGAAPGLVVEEVDVVGPTTSAALRAAGWAEAAVALAAARAVAAGTVGEGRASVVSPEGGRARAEVTFGAGDWPVSVAVDVDCGTVLDATVARSYAVGAAHMALGWVCSEGLAVDAGGVPEDFTLRSFGVLRAAETPPVEVRLADSTGPAVNGSDAVFAAVAAATWIGQGLPPRWPTRRAAGSPSGRPSRPAGHVDRPGP